MKNSMSDKEELEKEREKLNQLMMQARNGSIQENEILLEQSHKVDQLIARVQRKNWANKKTRE